MQVNDVKEKSENTNVLLVQLRIQVYVLYVACLSERTSINQLQPEQPIQDKLGKFESYIGCLVYSGS